MAIYKAIASTFWNVSTTWNEWDSSAGGGVGAWVIPFTSPLYPNSINDTVYLNNLTPIVNISAVTTGIISNAASTGMLPNAAAGGRLSLTVLDTPGTTTIKAASQFVYASTTSASSSQGLIDASAKGGFNLTIDSTAALIQVNSSLFTVGTGCTITIKGITPTLAGTSTSKLFAPTTTQSLTLDAVSITSANSNVVDLTTASGYTVTVTNGSILTGSNGASITNAFYALSFNTGSNQSCTIEGGTITSGNTCAAVFMSPAPSNIVKIKNDASAPNTSSAKIVNVNDITAIIAYKMQIDNNITGWDFQPASTTGTTTLSPTSGTYPPAKHVLLGVSYNNGVTGLLQQADAATVLIGTTYGVTSSTNDTPRTGTLDIPNAVAQVVGNIVANLT